VASNLTVCVIKKTKANHSSLKASQMQSTKKPWKYSHHTDSHLVPVKALLPGRKGSLNHHLVNVDKKLISESQEIFGDQTSKPARTMRAEIERVARRPYNILITGE